MFGFKSGLYKNGSHERFKILLWMLLDTVFLNASVLFSLALRYDINLSYIPQKYIWNYLTYMPFFTVTAFALFGAFRLYRNLWRFASIKEALFVLVACVSLSITHIAGSSFSGLTLPRSVYITSCLLLATYVLFSRFSFRLSDVVKTILKNMRKKKDDCKNIMIIGAGEAGNMLIREIKNSVNLRSSRIVCVIDDDEQKIGQYIQGVRIVGNRDCIKKAAEEYDVDQIIYAIPSASVKDKKTILDRCSQTGCELRILPGVYQLINGQAKLGNLRNVEIEDLLGREPVCFALYEVADYIKGKTVLITGGGGSIGSELCRQIAGYGPSCLVLLDVCENSLYDLQQEVKQTYPNQNFVFLVGSVRDNDRINAVFERYRPEIVFHAAAHKHVPLMEDSPNEAVKNNVFGTLTAVKAAARWKAEKFVLISTDKAVNPTNIMGATKRICEMIIQAYNKKAGTDFVAVRFGNVLNSNGSVIPLFKKQIESGGPVTVTHPEITRYFMTIPEAVSLVLQAGAFAQGGEIFILDMGEPVRIKDLAEKLIYLSGYTPHDQIKIVYTGLRPGEKLHEELLMAEEGLQATENRLIHIGKPIQFDENQLFSALERLSKAMTDERADIRGIVKSIVPTYSFKGDTSPAKRRAGENVYASTYPVNV